MAHLNKLVFSFLLKTVSFVFVGFKVSEPFGFTFKILPIIENANLFQGQFVMHFQSSQQHIFCTGHRYLKITNDNFSSNILGQFKNGPTRPLFVCFLSIQTTFHRKYLGFSGIRAWIIGIIGKHADHQTTYLFWSIQTLV